MRDIVAEIESHPGLWSTEDDLQLHLQGMLSPLGFEREYVLGKDRYDFFRVSDGTVVEAKTRGSQVDLLRQLVRYASREHVKSIIVVSSRPYLVDGMPESISGKPIHVAKIWQWGFA